MTMESSAGQDDSVSSASRSARMHYGWVIVIAGAMVLFSCLGLARFAYTMLLPGMQAGLGLSVDRMGFVGTANFIGYLASVFLAPVLLSRLRPRPLIAGSLLLIACGTLAISRSNGFFSVCVFYTLVGFGSGFANIPMMALVTYWFHKEQRGKAAGLMIAGNGTAIIFAGFFIPYLNRMYQMDGWRAGWVAIGCISLGIAVCAAVLLRNQPSELGLEPVGRAAKVSPEKLRPRNLDRDSWILVRLGLLYMIFGMTFMVYGTFIVTTMIEEYGLSDQQAGFYWSWVGFFSMFSGVGFGMLSDRIGRQKGLAVVFSVQTAAYLLTALKLGHWGLMASIVLYGLAASAIPAIMTAAVGDYLGISKAAEAFATITVFFGIGQAIGPAGAGLVAGFTGSFTPAYYVAAFMTAGAAVLAATIPPPKEH